jgi:hypothetical protein
MTMQDSFYDYPARAAASHAASDTVTDIEFAQLPVFIEFVVLEKVEDGAGGSDAYLVGQLGEYRLTASGERIYLEDVGLSTEYDIEDFEVPEHFLYFITGVREPEIGYRYSMRDPD